MDLEEFTDIEENKKLMEKWGHSYEWKMLEENGFTLKFGIALGGSNSAHFSKEIGDDVIFAQLRRTWDDRIEVWQLNLWVNSVGEYGYYTTTRIELSDWRIDRAKFNSALRLCEKTLELYRDPAIQQLTKSK